MNIVFYIIFLVIGYLIGSLNPAYLISKYLFNVDLKTKGSGNLGGTNAARVLGKRVGILVIVLDISKAFIAVMITSFLYKDAAIYAGLGAIVGHCFPFYLDFKGGKGVACYIGMLLSLSAFAGYDLIFTLIAPLLIFILVLGLTKMVSASSIALCISASLISFLTNDRIAVSILLLIMAILITVKHISNIKRIIDKTEPKIKWLV